MTCRKRQSFTAEVLAAFNLPYKILFGVVQVDAGSLQKSIHFPSRGETKKALHLVLAEGTRAVAFDGDGFARGPRQVTPLGFEPFRDILRQIDPNMQVFDLLLA